MADRVKINHARPSLMGSPLSLWQPRGFWLISVTLNLIWRLPPSSNGWAKHWVQISPWLGMWLVSPPKWWLSIFSGDLRRGLIEKNCSELYLGGHQQEGPEQGFLLLKRVYLETVACWGMGGGFRLYTFNLWLTTFINDRKWPLCKKQCLSLCFTHACTHAHTQLKRFFKSISHKRFIFIISVKSYVKIILSVAKREMTMIQLKQHMRSLRKSCQSE